MQPPSANPEALEARRNARNRGLLFWRLVCSLTDTLAPVAEQGLRQRREDQHDAGRAHAASVKERHNSMSTKWRREHRRREAASEGRTVRPYRRKAQPEPGTSA